MALPPEVRAKYIAITDRILDGADLTSISAKAIRRGIQAQVEYDITPQKDAINDLILERFDIFNAREKARQEQEQKPLPSVERAESVPTTNGHTKSRSTSESRTAEKRDADSEDSSDVPDTPPKKKRKPTTIEDDAMIAARLQAEEDRAARPTRGGAPRKAAPAKKKKTPKKKTNAKITGSDDSDLDDGEPTRKVNRDTGFHKPMNLSAVAADFFGEAQLSRPQVTKRIWEYIKGHDLQDPGDKRFILCDDKMKGLLKQDKVHMFTMTKLLNQHMYNPEE